MSLFQRGEVGHSRIVHEGRRYQRSLKTTSLVEARKLEAKYRIEIVNGEAGIAKAPTVRELGFRFLNYLPARVKQRSFRMYSQAWQKIDAFGPLASARLNRVDADLVNQFAQSLLQDGKAVISVNNVLRTLRRALFLAFEWRLLNREPRKIVKLLPGEHQRDFVFSETDEARVIAAAPAGIANVIMFAVDTGLRIGEITRLKFDDVEVTDAGPIAVRVTEGKTKNARRTVPLTKRVAVMLEELKQTARADVPWVFTRHNGRHSLSDVHVTCLFKKAVRACGISQSTPHVLHEAGREGCFTVCVAETRGTRFDYDLCPILPPGHGAVSGCSRKTRQVIQQ
jgi:integrase